MLTRVFLGYPLKDVIGFMGWAPLPFSSQGPWKIFGDPRESLGLAEAHRRSRSRKARQLDRCGDPIKCLEVAEPVPDAESYATGRLIVYNALRH